MCHVCCVCTVVKGDAGRPSYIRTFWLLYGADDVLSGPQSESSVDKGVVFTVISDMVMVQWRLPDAHVVSLRGVQESCNIIYIIYIKYTRRCFPVQSVGKTAQTLLNLIKVL